MQGHIFRFLGWSGLAGMGWPGLSSSEVGWARLGWAGGGPKRGWGSQKAKGINFNTKFNKEPFAKIQGAIFGFLVCLGGLGWASLGWAGLG